MTINEYMNELALESTMVANEMACDSMICDFYSANSENEESVAYESVDLAFDDDDDVTYVSDEPATEAGFFKSLGEKFKNVIEKVKSWFEKVANTIKDWITKFTNHIKDKIAAAKSKRQRQAIAGIEADEKSSTEALAKEKKEINDKINNLKRQGQNETNASKRTHIDAEIRKLEHQLAELDSKGDAIVDKAAIEKAKIYARNIAEGVKQADTNFKIACGYQDTIEEMMFRIMHKRTDKKDPNSALVKDKIIRNNSGSISDTATASSALKSFDMNDSMRKQLDKAMDELNRVDDAVDEAVKKVDDAYTSFSSTVKTQSAMIAALQTIKFTFPSTELTARATAMAKECQKHADDATELSKLFGNTIDNNSPEIARTLSAYSTVASKLVKIANSYLKMAGRGELAAIASAVM